MTDIVIVPPLAVDVTAGIPGPPGPQGPPGPPGPVGVWEVTQPAEGVAVPVFVVQPHTAGTAPFEVVLSSALFAGVYDQVAGWGFNPELAVPGGSGVTAQPAYYAMFENNYNNGQSSPGNVAMEYHMDYVAANGAAQLRVFQIDVARDNSPNTNTTMAAFFDLGTAEDGSMTRNFQILAGGNANPLFSVTPGASPAASNVTCNTSQFVLAGRAGANTVMTLNAVAGENTFLFFYDQGTPKWKWIYTSGAAPLYLHDEVNNRYSLAINPGVSATAALWEFVAVVKADGGVVCQTAALAANATAGFLYIPSCPGTPTGTPGAQTGTSAVVYNTTSHALNVYDQVASSWYHMPLTAGAG